MDGTRYDGTVDEEQRADFEFLTTQHLPRVESPKHIQDDDGVWRDETREEMIARFRAEKAKKMIPYTDHSTILRHGSRDPDLEDEKIVANVHSYDLTIGQGYAFWDKEFWNYLLDLADWKISDPYYDTGDLPPVSAYPTPSGLDLGQAPAQEMAKAEAHVQKEALGVA
jgi:hypothetical protein